MWSKYRLEQRTTAGGVPWIYDFEITSDTMALEYARCQVRQTDNFGRSMMSVLLWRIEPDGGGDLLAEYKVLHPEVEVKLEVDKIRGFR